MADIRYSAVQLSSFDRSGLAQERVPAGKRSKYSRLPKGYGSRTCGNGPTRSLRFGIWCSQEQLRKVSWLTAYRFHGNANIGVR